jgi:D-alanyl-D-alanine carboxypeptidase
MLKPIVLIMVSWCFPAVAADPADLSGQVEAIRQAVGVPALAVAVTDEDSELAWGVSGLRALGSEEAVQRTDRFHLGSLTKSMTATVVARLVERGVVGWDDTIERLNPDLAAAIPEKSRGITLAQLLSHRSGMPDDRNDSGIIMKLWQLEGPLVAQRAEAAAFLLARPSVGAPGESFAYSNANFIVAGHLIERVTGQSWEDIIQAELFEPLGMTTAGHGPPGLDDEAITQPRGHGGPAGAYKAVPAALGADNAPPLGPAGRVHCSIEDLATYARAHLAGLRGRDGILPADAFLSLHTDNDADGYALGWGVVGEGIDRRSSHSGSNTRWLAVIHIWPERNLAIVIAMNAMPSPDNGVDVVGRVMALLDERGLRPTLTDPEVREDDGAAP